MATYIPPHKRHSYGKTPAAEALHPRPPNSAVNSGKIVYDIDSIHKWLFIGCDENGDLPHGYHLSPFSVEALERRVGNKTHVLTNSTVSQQAYVAEFPWASTAEQVLNDLLISFESIHKRSHLLKPSLVARFGKILFHPSRVPRVCDISSLKRTFYTNVSQSYAENAVNKVRSKMGLSFANEKEIYQVKFSDSTRPGSTVSCKCRVGEDGALNPYKVQLNQVRHMTTDISCLPKDLDLRISLTTKEIMKSLTEEEEETIRGMIAAGVVDPDARGGLRWRVVGPGGGRFAVIGAWHISSKIYKSSSYRVKVRNADRFDNIREIGEVSSEVNLSLDKLLHCLKGDRELELVRGTLMEAFEFIWGNLLSCDDPSVANT